MTRAIRRCAELASYIYEIDLSRLVIAYNLENDHLAEASIDATRRFPKITVNPRYLASHPDLMVNEVAPHEVAHLVAFMKEHRKHPWNHGPRWREVTRALGGEGDTQIEVD